MKPAHAPAFATSDTLPPVEIAFLIGGLFETVLGFLDPFSWEGGPNQQAADGNEQHTTDHFGSKKLPAEEDQDENAEFDDQVGGGEHERHSRDEMRTFQKQRARRGQGGKGTG
ncbi:MAG: hypothetical protein P8Y73_09615 [Desulfuromonadales bacterium]